MVWLPDGENFLKICLFVSTECMNVTDGWTDGQTDRQTDRRTDTTWRHRPRLYIASRGKHSYQSHRLERVVPTYVPAGVRSRGFVAAMFCPIGCGASCSQPLLNTIIVAFLWLSIIVFEVEAYKYKAVTQLIKTLPADCWIQFYDRSANVATCSH